MTLIDAIVVLLILAGAFFFLAGTVGLLRFPDVYTRLHALTKADTLGVGMIALGVALHLGSWSAAAKLLLVWLLVMLASATACHLVAKSALNMRIKPWEAGR